MKNFILILLLLISNLSFSQSKNDSLLTWLKSGNNEYTSGLFSSKNRDSLTRLFLSKGQNPKAVIITCADSRVSPEIIFNKGLGELFVIRVAGNVINDDNLSSIEYAILNLHTNLIVIMGHTSCGAVTAAVNSNSKFDNHIQVLIEKIQQSTKKVKKTDSNFIYEAIKCNVTSNVDSLKNSKPVINNLVNTNQVRVVGSVYDILTGKVTWFE